MHDGGPGRGAKKIVGVVATGAGQKKPMGNGPENVVIVRAEVQEVEMQVDPTDVIPATLDGVFTPIA